MHSCTHTDRVNPCSKKVHRIVHHLTGAPAGVLQQEGQQVGPLFTVLTSCPNLVFNFSQSLSHNLAQKMLEQNSQWDTGWVKRFAGYGKLSAHYQSDRHSTARIICRISTVYTTNTYMHCICVCTVWSFIVVKYWYMHVIFLKLTGAQHFDDALIPASSFFQAFVE